MQFPAIDPVAFSIGSLQLRWYGLMYLLAFFVGWGLARWRASRPGSGWKTVDVDDLPVSYTHLTLPTTSRV